jgi:hypothetical protein
MSTKNKFALVTGGGVVAFLCTDEAWWINGLRIEVSGGQAL